MNIFDKGKFLPLANDFKELGLKALEQISEFQNTFQIFDTDTTINSIRDTLVADMLGFDLLNNDKHGLDAKRSDNGDFLEVKQCSITANRWGGTWNDTNEEKAKAFGEENLYTAVALWKGASDLQFIVFGTAPELGAYLYKRVTERKAGSRSTQNVEITTLLKWGFCIVVPPGRSKEEVREQLLSYKTQMATLIHPHTIKTPEELKKDSK